MSQTTATPNSRIRVSREEMISKFVMVHNAPAILLKKLLNNPEMPLAERLLSSYSMRPVNCEPNPFKVVKPAGFNKYRAPKDSYQVDINDAMPRRAKPVVEEVQKPREGGFIQIPANLTPEEQLKFLQSL
jgi:hypothetical protein